MREREKGKTKGGRRKRGGIGRQGKTFICKGRRKGILRNELVNECK